MIERCLDEPEDTEDSNTSEFDAKWFEGVLGMWNEIEEKLINAGLVMSVGGMLVGSVDQCTPQ